MKAAERSSEEDDNYFSDLLNLSVCVPTTQSTAPTTQQQPNTSVTTSMTGSDISSLANLGTPDSPPRATSPTMEMKEILDRIQQLPQQSKSPQPPVEQSQSRSKLFYHKAKAKTMYMPLLHNIQLPNKTKNTPNGKIFHDFKSNLVNHDYFYSVFQGLVVSFGPKHSMYELYAYISYNK